MNTAQKVIKYCALALAISLIVSIAVGALQLVGFLLGIGSVNLLETPARWSFGEEVTALDLEIAGLKVEFLEGETLQVETNHPKLTCKEQNGTLQIREKSRNWFGGSAGTLTVYLPADLVFEQVTMEAGAGKLYVEALQTKRLELELGAGQCTIQSVQVSEKASMEGGAGQIVVESGTLANLELELGVGELQFKGRLSGSSQIDCGVGSTALELIGSEDYRIHLEKGVGAITLNGTSMSNDSNYGTGANSVHISGGIGNIEIDLVEIGMEDQ